MDLIFSKHAHEQMMRRNIDYKIKQQKYQNIMKIKYDKEQDILYVSFSDDAVFESDEEKKGLILDYSAAGHIVGIEILNASGHVSNPAKVEYEFA